MPRYEYDAVDDYGKKVRGSLLAPDEKGLREALSTMGLHLVKARERAEALALPIFRRKVRRQDLIAFTFHLKTLVGSGVPVVAALGDLAEQVDHPVFAEVIQDVRRNIQAGAGLSESFALHPQVFPEIFVSIVRAGETTGNLDGVLADLTRFLTWQEDLSKTIRQATYYPATVVTAVAGLIFVLFTFVFPRFIAVFRAASVELPLPTRIVIAISAFFRDYGLYLLVIAALAYAALLFYNRTESGRYRLDGWKLKVPVVGPLVRAIEMSQFSHYLASLFRAGVEMTHSLWVVEKLIRNRVIAAVIRTARDELIAGGSLSAALRKSGEFPLLVVRMISAGETTGNLDETLENVSGYYDREIPLAVKRTFAVLEPLVIVILAVVVLGAALSFFLALYKMVGALGGKS
ncbi:MAG: type II secretion system F family protein [Deltaproteobacteria bacterium]|nr:type II secretion system F family protein [Deltaproteobacteria bacterium]